MCEHGYHYPSKGNDDEECMPCPHGTYKDHNGNSACIPCPEGTITQRNSVALSVDSCRGKLFKNTISVKSKKCKTSTHCTTYMILTLWGGSCIMSCRNNGLIIPLCKSIINILKLGLHNNHSLLKDTENWKQTEIIL